MKSMILRLVAGSAVKLGVAYAIRITGNTVAAIRGLLDAGSMPDDTRAKLTAILKVLGAVADFLVRLGEIIGAPPLALQDAGLRADLTDAAEKLRRITDGL